MCIPCILSIMEPDASLHFDIYWNAFLSCGSLLGCHLVYMSIGLRSIPYSVYQAYRYISRSFNNVEFAFAEIKRWASMLFSTETVSILLGIQVVLLELFFSFCLKLMLLTWHGQKNMHHTPQCPSWSSRKSFGFLFSCRIFYRLAILRYSQQYWMTI